MSQFDFSMNPKVNDPHADVTDAALDSGDGNWGTNDLGKIVALASDSTFGAVANGGDIEGVLVAVEPHTVNAGNFFGSVQRNKRFLAVVGAGQGTGSVAVGDYVVADAYGAGVGSDDGGKPRVKGGAGTTFKWRIVAIKSGAGAVGSVVVIERVNG